MFCANTDGGCCRRLTPLPAGDGAPTAEELAHLGAELAADVARGVAYGHLHPHTLQPFPAPGPARDMLQQAQQGQQQRQQQRQQASIAHHKQSSWMVAGAAQQQGQHGLDPSQLPPAMQQRLEQQWAGMPLRPQQQLAQQQQQVQQGSTDVSDVLHLCYGGQGSNGARAQQPEQQQLPPPCSGNPFARQPSSTVLAPSQQVGSCDTAAEAATAVAHSGVAAMYNQQTQQQRAAMQPITNLSTSQQTGVSLVSTQASATPALASQGRAWDRAEQYRPAQQQQQPAASGKRKSGGGGGSSKKAAKPLAPPSQRISRFFAPRSGSGGQ